MGLLGLQNMQYFVENFPEKTKQILDDPRDYPFAVAGINITSMLLEIFDVNGIYFIYYNLFIQHC